MEQIRTLSREVGCVAMVQAILLLPAELFMAALGLRTIPMFRPHAQEVVTLYADRVWTLWVFLLAFPLCVVAAGALSIASSRSAATAMASRAVAAMTAIALAILAIVMVHMLAN